MRILKWLPTIALIASIGSLLYSIHTAHKLSEPAQSNWKRIDHCVDCEEEWMRWPGKEWEPWVDDVPIDTVIDGRRLYREFRINSKEPTP